jgi:hypothetical protein
MSAFARLTFAGVLATAAVGALSFMMQLQIGLGACGEDATFAAGSGVDRFCDGPLVGWGALLAPILVMMAGSAAAIWKLRSGPLWLAGLVAFVLAWVPSLVLDGRSTGIPASRPVPTPAPDVPTDDTERLPPDEEAGTGARNGADGLAYAVGQCLATTGSRSACDDPARWQDELSPYIESVATVEVRVLSDTEWLVRSRTRDVTPVHSFRVRGELLRDGRARLVSRCSPTATGVCSKSGRAVAFVRVDRN